MTDLAGRGPLGQKVKAERGTEAAKRHMENVARLPCVICGWFPVEVHHCISGRFGSRKASDFDTIPLCLLCHRGPEGIHSNKAAFEAAHGPDTDYLPRVAAMIKERTTT